MNLVGVFAVSQRLLLHHLPAVAYHRIYINPVVVSRVGFAAVLCLSKASFSRRKNFW